MNRPLVTCLTLACFACGETEDKETTDTSSTSTSTPTTPTTTTPTNGCAYGGESLGCLAYEAECAVKEGTYNVEGGWFDDSQEGRLLLELAPNQDDRTLQFEVFTAELEVGTLYEVPNTLNATVIDRATPGTTLLWTGCVGQFTIDEYVPGKLMSASWRFQAELTVGGCEDIDYWTSEGSIMGATPCYP
jgi:hypothetical protein